MKEIRKYNEKNKSQKNNKRFFGRFYPTYVYERVENIPYDLIEKDNIKLVMIDMDNTIIDSNKKYDKKIEIWIKDVKKMGIKIYILSNSPFGNRVKQIAKELNVSYEYNANKPFLKGFKKIVESAKADRENILMIGDQIFTDIWGGNRFGVKTILVTPIKQSESFITRVKRPLERIILRKYKEQKEKGDNN